MAVYLRGICKTQLESDPKCYDEEGIGWFHLKCLGISAKVFHLEKVSGTAQSASDNGNDGGNNSK